MIGGSLARRYARALRDIGQEDRQVRQVLSEVEEFARLLDLSPGLREVLEAGHVNRRDKQSALEQVLSRAGFLPSTKSFLSLLVDKGRMNVLLPIVGELRRMVEELEGGGSGGAVAVLGGVGAGVVWGNGMVAVESGCVRNPSARYL